MAGTYGRRAFLGRGLGTAAGAVLLGGAPGLLAACGGSTSGSANPGGSGGVSNLAPRRGGKIVVGVTSEVDGFDPTQSHFDATGIMYAQTVFDPLVIATADGGYKPYLARSVQPNADFTTWTIGLRPGVIFHDGTPLDADAALMNFNKQLSSFLTGAALKNVRQVVKVDDMTVAIDMHRPWFPFPYYLGGFYIGGQLGFMVSPKMLNNPNGSNQPVGTGPFMFQEWVPNDHFTAVRNPHYWRPGLPYLDSIEYRPLPDANAQENSIRGGTVDIVVANSDNVVVDLRADSSLVVIDDSHLTAGEPDMDTIMLNTQSPPLDDLRVRQALAYATNASREISVVNEGVTPPSTGPFPAGVNSAPTGYPPYDPAKARSLVSSYEREKGPVSLSLLTTPSGPTIAEVTLLQQMWQAVGIRTSLQSVQSADQINDALLGKFQATTWTQFAAPDPDLNYLWWSTTTSAPVGQISINFSRIDDPTLQTALETGRSSSDPSTRASAYQVVARRLGSQIPYLWLDRSVAIVAAKPTVMNFDNFILPDGSKGWPARALIFPIVQMWSDAAP